MADQIRTPYTAEESRYLKSLHVAGWSRAEIIYRLNERFSRIRTLASISTHLVGLKSAGKLKEREPGLTSITQEAIDWHKKEFGVEINPEKMLKLVEQHPRQNRTQRVREQRAETPRVKKTSSSEVLGFAKEKDPKKPKPSYAAWLLAAERQDPQLLSLFQDFLEAGLDNRKTALEMLEDVRFGRQKRA